MIDFQFVEHFILNDKGIEPTSAVEVRRMIYPFVNSDNIRHASAAKRFMNLLLNWERSQFEIDGQSSSTVKAELLKSLENLEALLQDSMRRA